MGTLFSRVTPFSVGLVLLAAPQSAAQSPAQSSAGVQAPASVPQAGPPVQPEYVLGQGDRLTVKVFGHPELEETLDIRPDGRLSVQLLDDVVAAGLTPSALDALLTRRYREFFKDPEVTIIVRAFLAQRAFIGGEVETPSLLPLSGELSVMAAIFQAGGFRRTARTNSIILVRKDEAGKPVATRLDLRDPSSPDAFRTLKPYDVVFVPQSAISKVNVFIDQYVRQLVPVTMTAGFQYILGDTVVVRQP